MELSPLTHLVSAGGGGLTVAWITKLLAKSFIEQLKETAKELVGLRIEFAKVTEQLKNLQDQHAKWENRWESWTKDHSRDVAVISHRMDEAERDLNGLGQKYRNMEAE